MTSTVHRCVAIPAVVALALAAPAHAQPAPFVADTERVLAQEAAQTRQQRLVGGVLCVVLGGVSIAGGYALTQVEGSGLVDLSPIAHGFGYAFIAAGALNVVAGTTYFFVRFEQERMHDDLRGAMARGDGLAGAQRARAKVRAHARAERDARGVMRGVGYAVLGASVVAGGIGLALHRADDDRAWPLFAGALGGAVVGSGLLVGAAVDGPYTSMDARFATGLHVGIAPTPAGAAVRIGGAF